MGEFMSNPREHLKGGGCPLCFNKTEAKLYDKLQPIYPPLLKQFKRDWCKNIYCLPFDFAFEENKLIVELDGEQHFIQVWKNCCTTDNSHKFGCICF
jgi:hypothetical protein